MKSIGDFQSAVQRDLAWRKREISDIRIEASKPEDINPYILRSGQVLLCAHWEGFLKKSCQLYIDHIFSQDAHLKDLIPQITAIAYFKQISKAAESKFPGSAQHHIKLAKRILDTINAPLSKPDWSVHTEGNPGSEVVERIFSSIGIDSRLGMDLPRWTTTKIFINEQLVRDRHKIAHGEGISITKPEILERSDRLLDLLDLVSEKLLDAAERKKYSLPLPE